MNFLKYLSVVTSGSDTSPFAKVCKVVLLAMAGFISFQSQAVNLTPLPPFLTETKGAPMVMLNMSKDHQLFFKAYNEFSDLDGDGVIETQYKHSYKYYGYFDSERCYSYNTTTNRYVPVSKVDAAGYCTNATATDNWNGNFMNWGTMARMDVVRRILYGGFRAEDSAPVGSSTASLTVLERAHLPSDAHAFAKYYYGTDVNKLTPFNPASTTFTIATATGTATVTAAQITMCNVSYGNATAPANTNDDAPSILVADGNHALWGANERWQCYWRERIDASNGNNPAVTGLGASGRNPRRNSLALGTGYANGSYTARVEVCKPGLPGGFTTDEDSRCKLYPRGNYKPVGLLQKYGERNEAAFGLMTGSYDRNISGGVLRKNVASFTDEVDLDDGQFKNVDGIVRTLNRLKVTGYSYGDGTYEGLAGGCNFQQIGLVDGECRSWGNPLGEMYLESLRYLAGASANPAFTTVGAPRDTDIGLTVTAWSDPFAASTVANFGNQLCRRSNVINFNASVTSFDSNSWSGASSVSGLTTATVDSYTNLIGNAEGLYATGTLWSVGRTGTSNDGFCTAKALTSTGTDSLANATGVCPEAPTQFGGYKMAGAALYAHTTPIRSDFAIPANNTRAFKVDTYSVALSTGSPRIKVPVPGQPGKFVFISPAYRLAVGGGGGGTLVDYKVVFQTPTRGKYLVNWEDSEQGGDFDQDVLGTLEYSVNTTTGVISVTTDVIADATANPQGFGYAISGTNGKDGIHFHSGIIGFTYNDARNITVTPTATLNASGGCNNCQRNDPPTTAVYTMTGVAGESLKDPLWYAAKYGGFDRDKTATYTVGAALPVNAWDLKSADGSTGADGVPDNYFLAIDPAQLEASLAQVFSTILKAGGAAPAATPARTDAGGFAYQSSQLITPASGTVDAQASGQFQRYSFQANGSLSSTPDWDAGAKLTVQSWNTKNILTLGSSGTIPFRWSNLVAAGLSGGLLVDSQTGVSTTTLSVGENRLEWIRGNSAKETTTGGLRARPTTKLGAIINSTPWFVGKPDAGYSNSAYGGGYGTFSANNTATNSVFVAANDGMLHAFNGDTGDEYFAYVPRAILGTTTTAPFSKLSALTSKIFSLSADTANLNVDGSVMAADMKVGGVWGTYLFGTFGRGAKGVYALNITKPQTITESSTPTLAKWEFSEAANDPDMGYIIGKPSSRINGQPFQTGYMANGKWAAIYGNGYNSTNGKAALFILFADGPATSGATAWTTGTHYIKIPVGVAGDNGMAMATAVDSDNNGAIDVIYAGDLKGNIWKFNVSDTNPANWRVATTGDVPLYEAKSTLTGSTTVVVQPITTVVQPFPHPRGGYQLVFGTGKSLESNDYPMSAPFSNSIYGIWDRPGTTTTLTVGLTDLVEKSTTVVANVRYVRNDVVDYATKKGWYLKLPIASEGVVFNPLVEGTNRVAIKTLAPDGVFDGCRVDSIGYDMTLSAISGSAIFGALPGVTEVTGFYAAGESAVNSFETGRAGKYVKSGGVNADGSLSGVASDPNNNGSTSCVAGSPNCICDPGAPTQCVICLNPVICIKPWEKVAQQCVFRKVAALGSGLPEATFRLGDCDSGRLTWREIVRNR